MLKKKFGLLSSSVLYGLGGAAQRLTSFLLMPLFARHLMPADYGIVGLLASLPALLLPIFSLGISASIGVCYFAAEKAEERLIVIKTAKVLTTISALAMLVIAMVFLDSVTRLAVDNLDYQVHTFIAIVTVALTILCLPQQLEQQFAGRPIEYVVVSLAGALFTSLSSIVTIVFFKLGALGMLIGGMAGQALVWVLLLWLENRSAQEQVRAERLVAKALLKHGLPMLPSFLLLFVIQNWIRWPLEKVHGIDAVGLFSLGSSLGSSMTLLTSGFVAAWMPWVMSQAEQWNDARHEVAKRFTQYFIACGLVVLLFFCAAQPALHLLLPAVYHDAWTVVGLAAAANFVMSLFSLVLPPIYIAGRVYLLLVSQALSATVTIGATYFLLDLGIIGASFAVFVGSVSLVLAQIVVNVKFTNISPIPFDGGRLTKIILVLSLACGATFLTLVSDDGWGFPIMMLGLATAAGLIMLKSFPDRQLLVAIFVRGGR